MSAKEYFGNIEKVDFLYRNEFMGMTHNYYCAVCKEKSAVQDCDTGILQPCWDCQKRYRVLKLSWFDRLFQRTKP